MVDLTGQWALVTGAGRGIGRAATLAFARRGLDVIGVARTRSDLETLHAEVTALGRRFEPVLLDLSEVDAVERLLQTIAPRRDHITVIDCNATIMAFGPFAEIPWEVQERIIRLNILVPFRLVHELLPSLLRHKQSWIFFMSSQATMQPVPWMATYGAAKACIQYQGLALNGELRRRGIHVVTVIPAHTDTTAFETTGIPQDIKKRFGAGQSAQAIAERMATAIRDRPPRIVTNVPGYPLLRAGLGLLPISWLLHFAGKMFSIFETRAYYPKTDREHSRQQ